jgi:hypothetical protein
MTTSSFGVVFHDFQDRLMADAGTPASMRHQQEPFSEQRAQVPTVEIDRGTKQMPQNAIPMDRAHAD